MTLRDSDLYIFRYIYSFGGWVSGFKNTLIMVYLLNELFNDMFAENVN